MVGKNARLSTLGSSRHTSHPIDRVPNGSRNSGSGISFAAARRMPASKKICYGVAGLGHIAQVAVLPAFGHARRNSTLAAIISGDGQKLAELGDTYRVPLRVSYDGVDEALGRIDALY